MENHDKEINHTMLFHHQYCRRDMREVLFNWKCVYFKNINTVFEKEVANTLKVAPIFTFQLVTPTFDTLSFLDQSNTEKV